MLKSLSNIAIALLVLMWVQHATADVRLAPVALADATTSFAPQPGVTLREATAIAKRETGGRLLKVKTRKRDGQTEYAMRMLVEGERVVNVVVDSDGRLRRR